MILILLANTWDFAGFLFKKAGIYARWKEWVGYTLSKSYIIANNWKYDFYKAFSKGYVFISQDSNSFKMIFALLTKIIVFYVYVSII